MFSNMLIKIKEFFKYSESIFLARVELFTGFIVTAVSAMDWSPLLSFGVDTGFTWKQGASLGAIMTVKGIVSEWARRRNDSQMDLNVALSKETQAKAAEVKAKEDVVELKEQVAIEQAPVK